jgi:hypothetical protein
MSTLYQIWKSKIAGDNFVKEYINKYGDLVRIDSNNNWHSLNSPAFISTYKDIFWYYHGLLHRLDGPAVKWNYNRSKSWYIYGRLIGKSEDGFTNKDFEQYKINNNIVT